MTALSFSSPQFWLIRAESFSLFILVIGISGIPGSGKTTLSQVITTRLNERAQSLSHASSSFSSSSLPATFVPMDGFHLTRAALSAMPDPAVAHARRGAAFTFDAPRFLVLVQALRVSPAAEPVLAPSFDHAIKDPKDDDIAVLPSHRIVVLEGNYLALDRDVWRDAAALLDELWFVEVDRDVARQRLRERHVRAGIVRNIEEGDRRAIENDLPNGDDIIQHQLRIDEVVQSREDGSWVHE
ncbi:P-loop containing nucleoside triphosphate hydrolase protein [Mariannaea sp. PMI_226]|nr:P-loop containing nucleoside triphosphate hydrolase protein [Mariannaea sp. PMI_226]